MALKQIRSTGVVDGQSKNEHVTSGQADDWVGHAWKDRTIPCVSPHSGAGTSGMISF